MAVLAAGKNEAERLINKRIIMSGISMERNWIHTSLGNRMLWEDVDATITPEECKSSLPQASSLEEIYESISGKANPSDPDRTKRVAIAIFDDLGRDQAVDSFEVSKGTPQNPPSGDMQERPQIMLHLKKSLLTNPDQVDLARRAVKSVLRALAANGCVGKDSITFQSRIGTSDGIDGLSGLTFMQINYRRVPFSSDSRVFNFIMLSEGIISHTYAYCSQSRVSLFLNDTSQKTLDKIDSVLSTILNRSDVAALSEKMSQTTLTEKNGPSDHG